MRFLYLSWLCFKSTYGFLKPEEYLLERLFNSLMQMLFFVFLASYANTSQSLAVTIAGNAMIVCCQSCIGDLGMIFLRERMFGTMKVLLAGGKSMLCLFAQKGFFLLLDSLISFGIIIVIGFLIFDLPFSILTGGMIICIILCCASCISIGFLLGSFGIILPDINFVYNLFITLLFFLCGANISIHLLPLPLQWLASILPLTHGLQAMQLLIHGTWNTQVTFLMLQEVLCMVCYAVAAYVMFRILERAAMRNATIDLY